MPFKPVSVNKQPLIASPEIHNS